MKNTIKAVLSAVAILALPMLAFSAEGKSIYGEDNRLDYYEASPIMRTLSRSVVSLWKAENVVENSSTGKYDLTTEKLGDYMNLCPEEKFREQNTGAFCSGALVGQDLIMTAGHCVKTEEACAQTKLVFGFRVNEEGDAGPTSIDKAEVYSCAKIVKRFLAGEAGTPAPAGQRVGADYALIQLDRKVKGHNPLLVNRRGDVSEGSSLVVIGHPSGMPLKVAANARVREDGNIGYFVADLDTFGGNSGSAVFNLKTKKIEGILVRGEADYKRTPAGCYTVATFDQNGGRGEDVTKITALVADVPKPGRLQAIKFYLPLLAGEVTEIFDTMLNGEPDQVSSYGVDPAALRTLPPLPPPSFAPLPAEFFAP